MKKVMYVGMVMMSTAVHSMYHQVTQKTVAAAVKLAQQHKGETDEALIDYLCYQHTRVINTWTVMNGSSSGQMPASLRVFLDAQNRKEVGVKK